MRPLSNFVLRHKVMVIVVWAAALVAGLAAASTISDRYSTEYGLPNQEGYKANTAILETYGNGGNANAVVPVISLPAGVTVDSPGVSDQLRNAFGALDSRGLRAVSYANTGDRAFVTDDDRRVFGLVFTQPFGEEGAPKELIAGIQESLAQSLPAGSAVRVTGLDQLANVADDSGDGDGAGEVIENLVIAGAALVVLLFVFGSALAFMPLLIAGVAILTSFLAVLLLTTVSDVIDIVQYIISLIGMGVAIDYSLLLVTRWREERSKGHDSAEAVHRAMATAGRSVLFSGAAVAVGLLVLVLLPVPFLRSLGFGSITVPIVSVLVSLTLLPVLLATVGKRMDWPRKQGEQRPSRVWTRWATVVVRRPVVSTLAGLALLAPLVMAAFTMQVGEAPSDSLAKSGTAHSTLASIEKAGVPSGVLTPIDILVPSGTDPAKVVERLGKVPGVYAAVKPEGASWRRDGTTMVTVLPAAESVTTEGGKTFDRVNDVARADFDGLRVGGTGALLRAEIDAMYGLFPLMLTIVGLVTFVLLARAFRSIVLAVQAIALNALSIGAAYGVLVLVWQEGYGSEAIWGTSALGSVTAWVPLMTFAFLFGLSMDYQVFLLSRMRETYDDTGSTRQAIVTGLGRVGRLVTGAALILFLAFVGLAAVPEVDVRVMATGMGAAILIDATVLRMLLVPALTALTGRWTWWLPRGAAKLLRVAPSPVASPAGSAPSPAGQGAPMS